VTKSLSFCLVRQQQMERSSVSGIVILVTLTSNNTDCKGLTSSFTKVLSQNKRQSFDSWESSLSEQFRDWGRTNGDLISGGERRELLKQRGPFHDHFATKWTGF